jgi:hypothetical protein
VLKFLTREIRQEKEIKGIQIGKEGLAGRVAQVVESPPSKYEAMSSNPSTEKKPQIGKEKVKLSLFSDNMILYLKNPKLSPETLRPDITFSKVTRYKTNIKNQ